MTFEEVDKVVHPVETQWHYTIMVAAGWAPVTPAGIGFVRSYAYKHPTLPHFIHCNTGLSADYWVDNKANARGYWNDLAPHLAAKYPLTA